MSVKQLTVRDVEEIVNKKITELIDKNAAETTRKLQAMMDSMLCEHLQSLDLPKRLLDDPATLETIKNSFDDMDFVRQVHYADEGDALRLVIIHDHNPPTSAFCAISSRVSDIASSADRFDITPWILHESEILSHHLAGAKLLFQRPQKSEYTAGLPGSKPQSPAPANLDDPKILKIIKNSFDDMDFVRQVYHRYDGDEFVLIIIHGSEHFGSAHSAICNRVVKIEDLLHNVHIGMWILHESENTSRCLAGAKMLFKRKAAA